MVALVIAVLIAGNSIEGEEGGGDFFAADKVWLYVTISPPRNDQPRPCKSGTASRIFDGAQTPIGPTTGHRS